MKQSISSFGRRIRFPIHVLHRWISSLRNSNYASICREAKELYNIWNKELAESEVELIHPVWLDVRPVFAKLILDGVPYDFLEHPVVMKMFYRVGFGEAQKRELSYIRNADKEVQEALMRYKESPVGMPFIDCPEMGISANSLGMLYYFIRIGEYVDWVHLNSIVEFGGGYGCLCRTFMELLPKPPTYVSIDLPEVLSLQYVFLRASSVDYQVIAHTSRTINIVEGCVNLIPVQWIDKILLKPDLFVSTFALSEASRSTQAMTAKTFLPNAKSVYIVGQKPEANLWKKYSLEPMDMIHKEVKDSYRVAHLVPFHYDGAWELIACDSERGQIGKKS